MVKVRDAKHLLLTYTSLILIFVGVFTSEWSVTFKIIVLGKLRTTSGLFETCEESVCGSLKEVYSKEHVPTFLILAGCVAAVACVLTFTAQFIMWDENNPSILMLSTIAFVLSMSGALFIFVGCMIYSYDIFTEYIKPGYSFYVTFCGAMVLSLGGSLGPKY
ncbi:hypothetical protein BsWGS_18678 [Bradybaena similaris]